MMELFRTRTGITLYQRLRALIAGRKVFTVTIKEQQRFFFAKNLKQAHKRFRPHQVKKI